MPPPPDDHECGWRTHAEMVAAKLEALTAELEALKRQVHGKKSERRNATKLPPPVAPAKPSSEATLAKRRAAAELRNARIETTDDEVPVPADKRDCPVCGATDMPRMGAGKESSIIDYVPGYFRRKRCLREMLACRCGKHIVTAPASERVGEGTRYAPGFVAHLVVSKCAESAAQYRLEKAFARVGRATDSR